MICTKFIRQLGADSAVNSIDNPCERCLRLHGRNCLPDEIGYFLWVREHHEV